MFWILCLAWGRWVFAGRRRGGRAGFTSRGCRREKARWPIALLDISGKERDPAGALTPGPSPEKGRGEQVSTDCGSRIGRWTERRRVRPLRGGPRHVAEVVDFGEPDCARRILTNSATTASPPPRALAGASG